MWKAFGLVPTMLLNRPRGWGSIGRDELAIRVDKFASGLSFQFLQDDRNNVPSTRPGASSKDQTKEFSEAGQRKELIGASLALKTVETRELQEKRPKVRVWEIPHEVSFVQCPFRVPGPGGCTVEMLQVC